MASSSSTDATGNASTASIMAAIALEQAAASNSTDSVVNEEEDCNASTMTTTMQHIMDTNTSNHVYIKSKDYAWIPARVLETFPKDQTALVSIPRYKDEQSIQSDGGRAAKKGAAKKELIQLQEYPNGALLLQNVDENGNLTEVEDMVDLPFLHEVRDFFNRFIGWMPAIAINSVYTKSKYTQQAYARIVFAFFST